MRVLGVARDLHGPIDRRAEGAAALASGQIHFAVGQPKAQVRRAVLKQRQALLEPQGALHHAQVVAHARAARAKEDDVGAPQEAVNLALKLRDDVLDHARFFCAAPSKFFGVDAPARASALLNGQHRDGAPLASE